MCAHPDLEIAIKLVTLNASGQPVLHYQDPNPPSAVTGYDVDRSTSPGGPWTLLAHNVADMGPITPDIQYVDATGDVGDNFFYKVAAWNYTRGVQGPW